MALLFNGEVYNYEALYYRHGMDLEKPVKVKKSEGATLVRLYEILGSDFVKHLDGEFAI